MARLVSLRRRHRCGAALVLVSAAAILLAACDAPGSSSRRPSSASATWTPPTATADPSRSTAPTLPAVSASATPMAWPGWLVTVVGAPDFTDVQMVSTSGVEFTTPGSSPAWSPDGEQLAYVSPTAGGLPELLLVPREGGEGTTATRVLPDVISVTWSPTGEWLAVGRSPIDLGDSWIVRPDGSGLGSVMLPGAETRVDLWSPDGGRIAGISSIGGATAPRATICSVPDVTCVADGWGTPLAWSSDGTLLAIANPIAAAGNAVLLDLSTGTQRPLYGGGPTLVAASWSRQGRIAVVEGTGRLVIFDELDAEPRPLVRDLSFVGPVAWSPDGRWLAARAEVDAGAEIFVIEVDGPGRVQVTEGGAAVSVAWNPVP